MTAGALRIEDAARLARHAIWLDGPSVSSTQIGVRGFRYEPYDQPEPSPSDAYVVILYVAGRTPIRRTIDDVEEAYEVGPGDISLQPLAASRWSWCNAIDVLHVYIEPAYLNEIAYEAIGVPHVLHMRHSLRLTDDVLAQMGVDLVRELDSGRLGAARAARAVGERMAIHLLRDYFDIKRVDAGLRTFTPRQVATVQAWIAEHLGEAIHLEQLAALFRYSVDHFSRMFRISFGRAPYDYVRELRLRRARELIVASDQKMSSIAMSTGFADQSHLTRCFKKRFGMPPGELRRRELHDRAPVCYDITKPL